MLKKILDEDETPENSLTAAILNLPAPKKTKKQQLYQEPLAQLAKQLWARKDNENQTQIFPKPHLVCKT